MVHTDIESVLLRFTFMLILLSYFSIANHFTLEVKGDGTSIKIIDAFWGTSGNQISVGPGDEGVILTLVLHNSGSEIVSGLEVYLHLKPPFHNITGGDVAKGYVASTLQPGQLSNAQILLGVDEKASIGRYYLNARISYTTLKQSSETQSTSISESEQRSASSSKTSTSQSTSTSNSLTDTKSTMSSSSETTQTSTSSTKQTTSSSSTSYTKYIVNSLEQSFNVTLWLTGKVTLDVKVGANHVFAGSECVIPIEIINRGLAPASLLTVILTLPSGVGSVATSVPIVLLNDDNHWHIQSLQAGESVEILPKFLASNSAIDNTFQMQLAINYRDNVGTIRTEQRSIGILVKGPIIIILQDVFVIPQVVGAGGNITVTGTVNNEGLVSAMYVNASLLTTPPFTAYDGTSVYIGEVLPNTPMPFSLNVGIARDAENGIYTLPLVFYYKDNYRNTYSLEFPLKVTVQGVVQQTTQQQSQHAELFPLSRLTTFVLIVAAVAISSVTTYFVVKHKYTLRKGS